MFTSHAVIGFLILVRIKDIIKSNKELLNAVRSFTILQMLLEARSLLILIWFYLVLGVKGISINSHGLYFGLLGLIWDYIRFFGILFVGCISYLIGLLVEVH